MRFASMSMWVYTPPMALHSWWPSPMEFTVSGPKRAWLGKYVDIISWLQEKPPVATMIFFARISTVLLFFSSLKRTPMGAPSPSTMKFVARRFSLYVAPFCSKPFCSGVSTACMSPMPLPGNSMDVGAPVFM